MFEITDSTVRTARECSLAPAPIEKTNPSTGDLLTTITPARRTEVGNAVARAHAAFGSWASLSSVARGEVLFRLADLIQGHHAGLALMIATEHGKPMRDAEGEVNRTVEIVRFAAGMGRRLGGRTLPSDTPHTFSSTHRRPIGLVALITPWNFPLAIPAWKLAPALVSGCAVILKPSPLAPQTADFLAELAWQAGVPQDIVQVIHGDGETGELLIEAEHVAGVSFTGSVGTGCRVQALAGPLMMRTQLEMGGKNAVIVDADADVERAADAIVAGAFGQSGQRCSATSRVIALPAIKDDLLDALVQRTTPLKVCPPTESDADLGPVISEDALFRCLSAIEQSREDGGRVVTGGRRLNRSGSFLMPTIIDGLTSQSALARQEVFGPVLTVLEASSIDHAIRINNDVEYGMSATLFSRSVTAIGDFIERAEAGMLHVNRPGTGAFPHMPHVGSKRSQFGAAECSDETLEFFTETKTVTVDVS